MGNGDGLGPYLDAACGVGGLVGPVCTGTAIRRRARGDMATACGLHRAVDGHLTGLQVHEVRTVASAPTRDDPRLGDRQPAAGLDGDRRTLASRRDTRAACWHLREHLAGNVRVMTCCDGDVARGVASVCPHDRTGVHNECTCRREPLRVAHVDRDRAGVSCITTVLVGGDRRSGRCRGRTRRIEIDVRVRATHD